MVGRTAAVTGALGLVLLPSGVVSAVVPLLRTEWDASATALGWVFAAYQVGYLAGVLFVLPLTDRFPTGRVVVACTLVTAVASLLFPLLAHDLWSAAAVRCLAGVGLAGVYLPGVRIVVALADSARRGSAVGAYVSAFYLGAAVSLGATGVLLAWLDWRGAALVLGGLAALAAPLAAWATGGIAAPAGGRARLDLGVLRHGPVRRTVLAYAGHSWELYVSRGWLAAFVAASLVWLEGDPVAAASAGSQWAALMAGCGTIGVWLGGSVSDRVGRARAALTCALASGVCSLGFGWLGAAPFAVIAVVGCLYGLLQSADSAVYSTAITELAPAGRLGSAQAVQAFIGFAATVAGPVVAGVALDSGFGWPGVFASAGIVGAGLALPLLPMARAGRR